MTTSILKQLTELDRLDFEALKERWRALFGAEPPGYNRVYLTKRLGFRIQELAHGGLSPAAREQAARILDDEGYDELGRPGKAHANRKAADTIVAGTVLVREWGGEDHRVTMLTDGNLEYRGRRYKSLSAIARAITGTHWNGPRFFGLQRGTEKKA